MVELLQRQNHDFTTWHNVISTFRKYALGGITDHTVMLRAENIFQQARMLVGELSQRAQAVRRLQFVQQEEALGNFSFSIAPAMSLEEIGDAISQNFPILGLERWYVMFYSDVTAPGSVSSPPPEDYRLLMQYDEDKFQMRAIIQLSRREVSSRIEKSRQTAAIRLLLCLGPCPESFRFYVSESVPGIGMYMYA